MILFTKTTTFDTNRKKEHATVKHNNLYHFVSKPLSCTIFLVQDFCRALSQDFFIVISNLGPNGFCQALLHKKGTWILFVQKWCKFYSKIDDAGVRLNSFRFLQSSLWPRCWIRRQAICFVFQSIKMFPASNAWYGRMWWYN